MILGSEVVVFYVGIIVGRFVLKKMLVMGSVIVS